MVVRNKYSYLKSKIIYDWVSYDYFIIANSFDFNLIRLVGVKSYHVKGRYMNNIFSSEKISNIMVSGQIICIFFNKNDFNKVIAFFKNGYILLYLFRKVNCYDYKLYLKACGHSINEVLFTVLFIKLRVLLKQKLSLFNLVLEKKSEGLENKKKLNGDKKSGITGN